MPLLIFQEEGSSILYGYLFIFGVRILVPYFIGCNNFQLILLDRKSFVVLCLVSHRLSVDTMDSVWQLLF